MRKFFEGLVVAVVFGVLGATFLPNAKLEWTPTEKEVWRVGIGYGAACADSIQQKRKLTDEGGNYFCARSTTVNSGVSYPLSTTYGVQASMFVIQNVASATRYVVPDRILLKSNQTSSTVGVLTTEYAIEVDKDAGAGTSRVPFPTGRILPTPINQNANSTATAQAIFYSYNAGNTLSTPTNTANQRIVGRGMASIGQVVNGDEYVIRFHDVDEPGVQSTLYGNAPTNRNMPARYVGSAAPTVVPPQWYWLFHYWLTGAAASVLPAFEAEVCWYEYPI